MNEIEKALGAIEASTKRYLATRAEHEAARQASVADIVNALKAGARPTDVTDRSPFSIALVRSIARENGVAPARKGRPGST